MSHHIASVLAHHQHRPQQLLQILIDIQQHDTCITPQAQAEVAQGLNKSLAEVQGVVSFYSLLNPTPREYDIRFSHNIIDLMQGKAALMENLLERLQVTLGTVRSDGRVFIDNTSCIGMSDQAPAALVNGYTVTRLTPSRIAQMASLIENQVPLSDWPAEWFQVALNIQRKDLLLDTPFAPGQALRHLLQEGIDSGLDALQGCAIRGCGGAGFPLDRKWRLCQETPAKAHYVVCNADEGEPGTFKDRVLLQAYPDLVFEGMTLCAKIIGAQQGFVYLRGEYRYMLDSLQQCLQRRRDLGLLGDHILGDEDFSFDIDIHLGAGAYVCGAEVALIESLQGHRGVPRKRPPPFPVTQGYLGQPTVVNNVETFALSAQALNVGQQRFTDLGTAASRGTKLLSISGDCARPGVYEFPYGVSVREVMDACEADDVQFLQNAGPAGLCLRPDEFERGLCCEDVNTTGSLMVFNASRPLFDVTHNFAEFFVHESCGFCTPCRVGTRLLQQMLEKISQGHATQQDIDKMLQLSQLMKSSSHCGLGMTASNHITDSLEKFPALYQSQLHDTDITHPSFDLENATSEARALSQP